MVFGPAIDPSFVTWPTSTTAIAFALGELHEPQRRLPDLADTPGCAVQLVDHRGLDRVDDEHRRARRPCHLDDPGDIALGQDLDRGTRRSVEKAEALGPEADLGGRLLAGGVQDGTAEPGGRLEQERGLADPRLAAEKDQRPRDDPSPEDPVELTDGRRQPRDGGLADVTQRKRFGDAAYTDAGPRRRGA